MTLQTTTHVKKQDKTKERKPNNNPKLAQISQILNSLHQKPKQKNRSPQRPKDHQQQPFSPILQRADPNPRRLPTPPHSSTIRRPRPHPPKTAPHGTEEPNPTASADDPVTAEDLDHLRRRQPISTRLKKTRRYQP